MQVVGCGQQGQSSPPGAQKTPLLPPAQGREPNLGEGLRCVNRYSPNNKTPCAMEAKANKGLERERSQGVEVK